MVEISVIIPVYNTSKYLKSCLNSIIHQTFNDIEIICVDDGSTDNSLEILRCFEKFDSRVIVFSQENQGQGAARNNALSHVSGKYTYFMDSDDILELNALEELYNLAEEKSLDMIIFKLINVDEETNEKYIDNYYEMSFLNQLVGDNVFNYKDIGEKLYDVAVSPPGKLFKTELISNIRFPVGFIFEDNPFFIESFFKAKRVYFYNAHLYNRLRRNESLISTNELYMDVIPISNMIVDITKKNNHYDEFKDKILNKKIFSTYYRFTLIHDSLKKYFFNEIKKDFNLISNEINENIELEYLNDFIFRSALSLESYKDFEFSVKLFREQLKNFTDNTRLIKHNEIIRIELKNYGAESNSIEMIYNSDINSKLKFPEWLNGKTGNGMAIESNLGKLDLKLKMINAGNLEISIKSLNLSSYGIVSSIDYTSLIINGQEYLNNHNIFSHEKPFYRSFEVKNSEIITIHVEWMIYDKIAEYVKELDEKTKKHERLTNESFKLINKLNEKVSENHKLQNKLNEIYSTKSWKITKPLRRIKNFKK